MRAFRSAYWASCKEVARLRRFEISASARSRRSGFGECFRPPERGGGVLERPLVEHRPWPLRPARIPGSKPETRCAAAAGSDLESTKEALANRRSCHSPGGCVARPIDGGLRIPSRTTAWPGTPAIRSRRPRPCRGRARARRPGAGLFPPGQTNGGAGGAAGGGVLQRRNPVQRRLRIPRGPRWKADRARGFHARCLSRA